MRWDSRDSHVHTAVVQVRWRCCGLRTRRYLVKRLGCARGSLSWNVSLSRSSSRCRNLRRVALGYAAQEGRRAEVMTADDGP